MSTTIPVIAMRNVRNAETENPSWPPPHGYVHPLHVLYSLAFAGSWLLLIDQGTVPVAAGAVILTAWAIIFSSDSRPTALCFAIFVGLLLGCFYATLAAHMAAGRDRTVSRRSNCVNNMKQIMLSLWNYHDEYKSFPPAVVTDADGRPMYSWRVLLLPYVDENWLYTRYRLDEPWDSTANIKLLQQMPRVFACPTHFSRTERPGLTNYVAVTGSRSSWPDSGGQTLNDFPDGTANTVMVIESAPQSIPWTAPRDIPLPKAVELLASTAVDATSEHRRSEFFYEYQPVRHVGTADGRVVPAPTGMEPEFARALLQIDDGAPATSWNMNHETTLPYRRLRLFNVFRLALFLVLAVLPLPWVFLNPRPSERVTG